MTGGSWESGPPDFIKREENVAHMRAYATHFSSY